MHNLSQQNASREYRHVNIEGIKGKFHMISPWGFCNNVVMVVHCNGTGRKFNRRGQEGD